jgi:hypothetical protein
MNALGSEIVIAPLFSTPTTDEPATVIILTTAELAECTCPEFCERDHDND